MRTSELYFPTLKETPADAELASHRLMLRAGMIRKVAAGVYSWLPLGLKVLRRVEQVVREEMQAIGAQEILMPSIQPAELWQESGRWQDYGPHLLKITDRHQRLFCYGPTHEEVITDLVRHEIRSYKQLPVCLYQIQTKFRDEIRPRFGVMRAREFTMKDAYSFHLSESSLEETYQNMFNAYSRIFTRLGLDFRPVLADTGNIGGDKSYEFQVLAQAGEDLIAYSDQSDYAANIEKATYQQSGERPAPSETMTTVDTPKQKTIADIVTFLNLDITSTVKTLIVRGTETDLVALVLRGDHELNEIKAAKHPLVASPLQFIEPEEIATTLNCQVGSLGPVGLDIPVIVDHSAALVSDFCCGANVDDKHYVHVNWQRDVALNHEADLRNVVEGDMSPDGKGKLRFARGIEVGQVFQLGNKYSKAMNFTVLNEQGKAQTLEMGCYGIGVSRTVAAAIEQHHDDRGIIWPKAMAPFQIAIVPINLKKSTRLREACNQLVLDLEAAGFEVLLDDREQRTGVLFADMDLLGIPHRLVLGDRGLDGNRIEYKARHQDDDQAQQIDLDKVVDWLKNEICL